MGSEHWLVECYKHFPKVVESRYNTKQDLDSVEQSVREIEPRRAITSKHLCAIETNPAWEYDRWWNRHSEKMGDCCIKVPDDEDLEAEGAKERLARALWDRIKDIKVVSVHLRFILPDEFAIFSDPVVALLNLAPQRTRGTGEANNRVAYYMRYLRCLRDIRKNYMANLDALPTGGNGLPRIADIERALWCA